MTQPEASKPESAAVVSEILRDVCELPDYTSPDDQPDLLQCTVEELTIILERNIDGLIPATALTALTERVERLEEVLREIAGKNDLSEAPVDEVESYARNALYECEVIARAALKETAS